MKTDSKYNKRTWRGLKLDLYRFLELFGVAHPAHQHAVKKLVRAGKSIKPLVQDINEVIEALERWKDMIEEDAEVQEVKGSNWRPESSEGPSTYISHFSGGRELENQNIYLTRYVKDYRGINMLIGGLYVGKYLKGMRSFSIENQTIVPASCFEVINRDDNTNSLMMENIITVDACPFGRYEKNSRQFACDMGDYWHIPFPLHSEDWNLPKDFAVLAENVTGSDGPGPCPNGEEGSTDPALVDGGVYFARDRVNHQNIMVRLDVQKRIWRTEFEDTTYRIKHLDVIKPDTSEPCAHQIVITRDSPFKGHYVKGGACQAYDCGEFWYSPEFRLYIKKEDAQLTFL